MMNLNTTSVIENIVKKRITKKSVTILHQKLALKKNEKDVEGAWREIFTEYFLKNNNKTEKYILTSPYGTDGFIAPKENISLVFALRILLEFKDGTNLTRSYDRARIMAQVIHYMKTFRDEGYSEPTVIVGADENQAFVLYAPHFIKYLDRNYNWSIPPSAAYKQDLKLMHDLQEDKNTAVWPYNIDQSNGTERYNAIVSLFTSIETIVQNGKGEPFKIKITSAGITGMFDEFKRIGLRSPEKVTPPDAVNLFMQMIVNQSSDKYYFVPNNRNKFHLPGDKTIDVYGPELETFFNHYDRNMSILEKDHLISIADRLIQDDIRRRKGDFWTPTIWANRANELMKRAFGNNYKETSLIWDPAAGTRNLTRDYQYSSLYISTIHDAEIQMGNKYNSEAKAAFQYDFLNDDVNLNPLDNPDPNNWKIPNNLFYDLKNAAITGKRVIFYTNPPYGTATNVQADGSHKSGIAKNATLDYMKKNNYGNSSQQLYAQFFARVIKIVSDFNITNASIAFFTKPRHLFGGDDWRKFNTKLFSKFNFIDGNIFCAGEFSDTADTWPITFSIYSNKGAKQEPITLTAESKVWLPKTQQLHIENIKSIKPRMIYKEDSLSYWAKKNIKEDKVFKNKYPQLSSALKLSKGKKPRGKLLENSLGYMVNNSNNVGEGISNSGVWIVTGSAYKANGFNVLKDNFNQAVVTFAARRSVMATWINDQENYKSPDEHNSIYPEFVNDSLIYSLFDNASYQSSYRGMGYSNCNYPDKWINEWFWIPIDQVKKELNRLNIIMIFNDARTDYDRYVAKEIKNRRFSKEAAAVLNLATQVWLDTLPYRELVIRNKPNLMLEAWDAGWYQIKQIAKLYPVDSYNEFREKFKILKKKISKNVYELGMLSE